MFQNDPPNHYKCPCGFETHSWANLVSHRRNCDTYKQIKLGAGAAKKEVTRDDDWWECPHDACGTGGNGGAFKLWAHLKNCIHANNAQEIIDPELLDVEFASTIGRLLDFEAWCRENGRD